MESRSSTSSSTCPEEPRNSATLSRKQRKTQKNSEMDNAGEDSLTVIRPGRRQERHRRSIRSKRSNLKKISLKEDTSIAAAGCNNYTEEDEKVEVEKKIAALQKIVPGGESLGVDKLFEETAGYILELQYQVKALKFLASFVEGFDKENRKFGG